MDQPLKQYVGYERLEGIVQSFCKLIGCAVSVCEPDGQPVASALDAPYCRFLDQASRKLCGTGDTEQMKASGLWHCHESCWTESAKITVETGESVDLRPCRGGLNVYAVPIVAESQVIGTISFGYGGTLTDDATLRAVAERYETDRTGLRELARGYVPRPDYVVRAAKQQLRETAAQIAVLYLRGRSEAQLRQSEARHKQISELVTDGIYAFSIDPEGRFSLEWSCGTINRNSGHSSGTTTLDRWRSQVHQDERSLWDEVRRKVLSAQAADAERTLVIEYRLEAENQGYIWVRDTLRMHWNAAEQRIDRLLGATKDISRQKQVESDLRANEARYRGLFESMSDGVAVYGAVGEAEHFVFEDFNRAAERITGLQRDEVLGRRLDELFPGAEGLGLPDALRRVWRTGEPEQVPVSQYLDNRIALWVENYLFRLPGGEVVAVFEDVTSQKQAERALRESEQRLRESQAYARVGYWELYPDGQTANWSEEVYRIMGLDPTVVAGPGTLRAIVHPEDCTRVEASLHKSLAEALEYHVEYRIRRPNGECRWVECRGKPVQGIDGRTEKLTGFVQDITERKRVEQALRRSEERFEFAMKGANEGLFDWHLKTNQMYYSPRWKSMLGYRDEQLENELSTWERLVEPEGRERSWVMMRDYMEGRRDNFELEFRMRHKDGHWVDILSRAYLVRDDQGEPVRAVGTHVDISARKRAEAQIEHLAFHDHLTGLPNRLLFKEELRQALAAFTRDERLCVVHILDLDHFKDVNDSLGHPVGDDLLKAVAGRIVQVIRASDVFARLGGDEFGLIQRNLNDPSDASFLAAKIVNAMGREFRIQGNLIRTNVSIGIVVPRPDSVDVDGILSQADAALYKAKDAGRGTYAFFEDSMTVHLQREMDLINHLRWAVQRGELFLDYQPQFALPSRRLVGVEALLRWNHPERGVLMPRDFLPVAEKRGFIGDISDWVLERACRQAKGWTAKGFAFGRVAVNISAVQINDAAFQENVVRILRRTEVDPAGVELEFTETVLMEASDSTRQAIHNLSELGVRFAIDDFGTGFSSLNYLRKFRVDKIKIDREFVKDVITDPNDAEIVKATIALGAALGLTTTAEGVETQQQADFLTRCGCNEVQGYFFGRPVPASEIEKLAAELRQERL